jgi:transcriptional regulator with XRE-family HTH domain
MAILLERKVWRRERKATSTERLNRLAPDEGENVLAALGVLRSRRGSWALVATVMGVTKRQLSAYRNGELRPSAGLALRVARLAGVAVDDVLNGKFAAPRKCHECGRMLPVAAGDGAW